MRAIFWSFPALKPTWSPHLKCEVCLRTQILAQVPCQKARATFRVGARETGQAKRWKRVKDEIHSIDRKGDCLTRSASGESLDLVKCKASPLQQWLFENPGTLSASESSRVESSAEQLRWS